MERSEIEETKSQSAAWRFSPAKEGTTNSQGGGHLDEAAPADAGPKARRSRGISIDWYTRLEQGRESLPSKATAEALAQALLLSPTDRSHLLNLATGDPGRIFKRESVPTHLVKLVQELSVPAYILGTRLDLLCWNKVASEIFRDFSKVPEDQRNMLYQMFTSAEVRERYPNWELDTRAMLESFRVTYDFWAHAPEFIALKDELCLRSTEFRKWWKTHQIRAKHSGEKVLKHRKLGEMRLRYSTFQSN
jgi:hypothetical protein